MRLRGQTTPFRPNTAPPIPHHEICQSDRPSGAFKSDRLLGSYLITKADLKSVLAIRGAYGALFPEAEEMRKLLGDRRLWNLNHKRNLIVHKRGVVDQAYLDATGDNLAVGDDLWVAPSEVEDLLETTLTAGGEIVRQVANAG